MFNFSITADRRIWFRNFQLVGKGEELQEVGPRMVLDVIKIFGGSFQGEVLYDNDKYVSPNHQRRELRLANMDKVAQRQAKKTKRDMKMREEDSLSSDSD